MLLFKLAENVDTEVFTVFVNVPLTCEIFYEIDYNMYRL